MLIKGLLGEDLTVGGWGTRPISVSTPSVVRSIPFSRQSCLLRNLFLLVGGALELCASPADCALVSVLPEGGTVREEEVIDWEDVLATAASRSWLWFMLWRSPLEPEDSMG